jgi:hypothetical protein
MMGTERPVSIWPLVIFRVCFGLLMLASTLRFIAKGWVGEFYLDPGYHFPYWGFEWLPRLPGPALYGVFILMAAACVGIILGWAYRPCTLLFGVLFSYIELLDKTYYLNHYYLVSLLSLWLFLLPADRAYSWRAWCKPEQRLSHIPALYLWLLRAQIGLVYFFAGLAKLNSDWLFRAMPLAIWLPARADLPVLGPLFDETWVVFAMSWGGAVFDLSLPWALMWRRSRPLAYFLGGVFHVLTALLFPIGVFPWMMILLTLIFFDEGDWARLKLLPSGPQHNAAWPGRAWLGLAMGLIALQILLPLRHLAYPGNVNWTEEGYRFSWRVMLNEKSAWALFHLYDPQSGRRWVVYPSQYLTPQQAQQMAFQADMLLNFAHYLRDLYQARGYPQIEVRAEVYVSWNGRPSHLLLDPQVNLAQESATPWAPKAWILPAPGD